MPSNLMSNCADLSSTSGMSGGQSDQQSWYNDVNAHQSFGNGTPDEMDMGTEHPFHLQQLGPQTFQHPEQPMQQQFQSIHGGLGGVGPLEDPESMLLQQQQQQLLQMQRQALLNAAAAQTNALQRQRLLQIQQQQQMQPRRSPVIKLNVVTLCTNRIAQYIFCQNTRPRDNNIGYWKLFVAEFFTPNAKKKWCVSLYGKSQLANGVAIPEDAWHCEICNHKPGQGFEAKFEHLPRLFEIKYETGIIEELLYVDLPRGTYFKPSGRIALTYDKAVQHTIYEQLRVVREGRLRILFTPDLKIHSWEFCAIRHEELVPRRQLTQQVRQLANTAQKYLACTEKTSSNLSAAELQNTCDMFVTSAREVAEGLKGPLLDEFGYSKRYVLSLKISGVLEHMSMKEVMDFCWATGAGPIESFATLNGRPSASSSQHQQAETSSPYDDDDDVSGDQQQQDPDNQNLTGSCLQQ